MIMASSTQNRERLPSECPNTCFQLAFRLAEQVTVVLMAERKDVEVESKDSTKHNETALSDRGAALKLDPHGFPLRPQPSDDPLGTNKYQTEVQLWNLLR
jgi:hypothetical protein